MKNSFDTSSFKDIESTAVGFSKFLRSVLNVKNKHLKAAGFGNCRIKLTKCSRSEVSRIGSSLFAKLLLLFIELFKSLVRHVNLTSKLKIIVRKINDFLDIRYHESISCYILTDKTVSSGLSKRKMKHIIGSVLIISKR